MKREVVLALESSQRSARLALCLGDRVVEKQVDTTKAKSSAMILPLLQELCEAEGVSSEDVSDFALHVGPGSGTGLRMGIAMAQAWSLVYPDLVVHAIPLEACALECLRAWNPEHSEALLLSDAFGGELFCQKLKKRCPSAEESKEDLNLCWELDGEMELLPKDCVLDMDGSYAVVHDLGALREKLSWPTSWTWCSNNFPTALQVLAASKSGDHRQGIEQIDVRYLKPSSAELNWRKRQGEALP